MSHLEYIASDRPFEELKSRHYRRYSINEALEAGIDLSGLPIDYSAVDLDKPDVICVDDEAYSGELEITPFDQRRIYDDIYTEKPYTAYLELEFNESRGERLIEYIRHHLETTTEVELWSIWLGEWNYDDEIPQMLHTRRLTLEQLNVAELARVFAPQKYERPRCIVFSKTNKKGK